MTFATDKSAALAALDATTVQVKNAASSLDEALTAQATARAAVFAIQPDPVTPPPLVTPSADGTSVPPAGSIIDGAGVKWSIVTGQVARNDKVDTATSAVAKLVYKGGKVYQQNTPWNDWYVSTGTGWAAASDPTGTPTPPLTGGTVALPAAPAGWKVLWEDGFDYTVKAGDFPADGTVGGKHWACYDGGGGTTSSGNYHRGLITVGQKQPSCMELNLTAWYGDGKPGCAAPLPMGYDSATHWRRKARFKVASGNGAGWYVAWLGWSARDNWPDGELDFPEGGLDGNIWVFIHDTQGNPGSNVVANDTGVRFNDGQWHEADLEWTAAGVVARLDGREVGRIGAGNGTPTQPMRATLQTEGRGQPIEDCLVLIDYVQVLIPA